MEEFKPIEDLVTHTKAYVDTRIDEARLAVAEKASKVVAGLIAASVVSAIFFFGFMLSAIAASILAGLWFGDLSLGFIVVAGICFILGIIVWAIRGWAIRVPVLNAMIRQLFQNDHTDEKD